MNANELYLKNGKPTGIWFCETCRIVARTKEQADACCAPSACTTCGKPVDKVYWSKCDACLREEAKARETARFDKATKIPDTEYRDWVTDGGDGFWCDAADYLESFDGEEPAAYLWACTGRQFVKVDFSRIIEDIGENSYDDFDSNDLDGVEEFKKAIAAFEEANKDKIVYTADYTRAVIVTPDNEEKGK